MLGVLRPTVGGFGRRIKRGGWAGVGAIVVAVMFLPSPAMAYHTNVSKPPWNSSWTSNWLNCPPFPLGCGTHGTGPLSAYASNGYSYIGPWSRSGVLAANGQGDMVGYWGPQGKPLTTGYHYINYTWKTSWSATLADLCYPPSGSAASVDFHIYGNLRDVTSGTWVMNGDVSVTIFSMSLACPLLGWYAYGTNQLYNITFLGYLYNNQVYQYYSYATAVVTTAGAGVGGAYSTLDAGNNGNYVALISASECLY